MPNVNVFERLVGANSPAQGTLVIPSLTLASNVETLFPAQVGGTAILGPPNSTAQGSSTAPSFGVNIDGFPFRVRAAFKVTTGGTSTAVIAIYVGSTIVAGNKVATITSQSLVTTSASGYLEANLIWDAVSQKISGFQVGCFGTATPLANTALSNTAIAVTSVTGLQFVATANLGSNVAGSIFTLTEFCMEAV